MGEGIHLRRKDPAGGGQLRGVPPAAQGRHRRDQERGPHPVPDRIQELQRHSHNRRLVRAPGEA